MSSAYNSTAGNARNGQGTFISTWITDDYEYGILVRHDWHPIVCQRTRNPIGEWVTHDIYDTVIGLIEVTDSHMGISIAVDPNGKVHVSGNTHDTFIRHIQTVNAHDITSWETSPLIDKQARYITNLAENGVVENNQNGWTALDSRFTIDRVTHAYGWGSSSGNDTNCKATRLTRTDTSPDKYLGIGVAKSISGSGFPVTVGEYYNTSLSFRTLMVSAAAITHGFSIVWRNGTTELSRTNSDTYNVTSGNRNLWYRCVARGMAPATADNCIIEFYTETQSGNSTTGDAMWVDGLMLYTGDATKDILYRDGSFNGGTDRSCWSWNGTPYASTSTGPLASDGYAGINVTSYNRFQCFSDGTLLFSHAQNQYMNDPVGRAWAIWKMEPIDTEFKPLQDNSDACIMKTTTRYVLQGATYPALTTGNVSDDALVADRSYSYGVWVDKNDVLHVFCWFRVKTSTSYGSLLYMKSLDKGQTWQNVEGESVTLPLTYPSALDTVMVSVDGTTPINCSVMGGVAELNGNPIIAARQTSVGDRLIYWNGTAWVNDDISSYAFLDIPSVVVIRGDIWLFGVKTVGGGGARGLWGVNHTQNTGTIVKFGSATVGTPDGVYTFESGASYESVPVHAGGLDSNGNYIFKRLLPDNEDPRIVHFGDGVRGNTA